MSDAPAVIDVTTDSFQTEVIEASHRRPVLVDFWAAWCGPCKSLMPLLTSLAEEYGGAFRLAKVNIDEQQELALRFGVRSVPTVKLFRFGEVVDEFLGVQPEAQIRAIVEPHIERESDRLLAAAREQFEGGDAAAAVDQVRGVLAAEPENRRAQLTLVEMLTASGEFAGARAVLDALPVDIRLRDEVQALLARLEFAEAAAGAESAAELERALAADPAASELRYRLGAKRLLEGDHEGALEAFLELMRRDRGYGDDAGRKGMLRVFELLGDSELVARYRRQMSRLLY